MPRFSILFLALVLALSGCWYGGGHANGANNRLTFAMAEGSVAGTNLPFHIVVVRYPDQWQNICSQPATSSLHIEGGDPCNVFGNTLATTPIALTKAQCDGGACEVVADAAISNAPAGSLTLRVTPRRQGKLTVNVSVRAADGSAAWNDAYGVAVDDVTRVSLLHELPDDAPASVGVLPGTPVAWTPEAMAQNGTVLAATTDAFAVSWVGGAVGPGASGKLYAQNVGTSTVTVHAAGLSTTESVRVVDPNDVQKMEVRRTIELAPEQGARVNVEANPVQGDPLAQIDLGRGYETGPFVLVLTMADGSRALGGGSTLAVQGGTVIVQPVNSALHRWTFWVHADDPTSIGPAILTGQVGQAALAIPILPAPGYVDGGQDADAAGSGDGGSQDAGAADAAGE